MKPKKKGKRVENLWLRYKVVGGEAIICMKNLVHKSFGDWFSSEVEGQKLFAGVPSAKELNDVSINIGHMEDYGLNSQD